MVYVQLKELKKLNFLMLTIACFGCVCFVLVGERCVCAGANFGSLLDPKLESSPGMPIMLQNGGLSLLRHSRRFVLRTDRGSGALKSSQTGNACGRDLIRKFAMHACMQRWARVPPS